MRVLGVVPARSGSRRVPGKNLALLEGRTLVRRALETCLAARRLATVALTSDAPAILAEADGLDRVLVLERPGELAGDTALAYDVTMHALGAAQARAVAPFDAVAIVQCTSPFTLPEDIDRTIELLERSGAESAVTITRSDDLAHPLKQKVLDGDRLQPFLRDDELVPSHELPELWVRNGAVYCTRTEVLGTGRLLGSDVRALPMPRERSLDINTPLDLAFAEFLLDRQRDPSP
jgi:CMP-N,N'-diacetyllegionaminic acid synthase